MEETRNSPFSNNVDRISNLPESLIHHILSFLDMKYVVQTCILSTRWRYIWTSASSLDSGENKVHSFMRFVKKVLMLRGVSDIKKFEIYFDCNSEKLAKHLDSWILAVVRRNVQEIDIQIERNYDLIISFPCSLVTSESLTKVVLDFDGTLRLPDSMSLPRLEYMCLSSFGIDDLNLVNKLLSSCPVLKALVIRQIWARVGDELCVNICGLKQLEISHYHLNNGLPRIIKLRTPSLTSFISEDYMIREYSLENLSSLVSVNFKITRVGDENIGKEELFRKHMLVLLVAFRNVKELTLSADFLQVLAAAPNLRGCQLPQFRNLQCLKLGMRFNRCCLRALAYLLTSSPCVESLFITSEIATELLTDSENDAETVLPGSCILSHLKYIEVREVEGCNNELVFLEFVLKNAIILEEMVLYFCNAGSSRALNSAGVMDILSVRKKFGEKIKALPRVSSCFVMVFS